MAAVCGSGIKTHNIRPVLKEKRFEVNESVHCNIAKSLCLAMQTGNRSLIQSVLDAGVTLPCRKHYHRLVEYNANSALQCAQYLNVPDVIIQMAEHYENQNFPFNVSKVCISKHFMFIL